MEIRLDPLRLRDVRVTVIDDESGAEIDRFTFEVSTRGETVAGPGSPALLHLPADSGYSVHVGAWGWLPAEVTINPNVAGDVPVRLKRGYADNAELELGWSLGRPDDDGVGGLWERGVPVGVAVDLGGGTPVTVEPSADHTPGAGVKAFMTGIISDPDAAPGVADVDSGRVTLTSPEFDLTDYGDPVISFALWYSNDALPIFPADDRLYIRLSNDGGQSWTDVLTPDAGFADWEMREIRVADFLTPTNAMYFRVVAADSGEQGWIEAGLDDFLIVDRAASGVGSDRDVAGNVRVRVAPNPVRDVARFALDLPVRAGSVRFELFDLPGRRVALLHEGEMPAGMGRLEFRAADLPEGSYFWRLQLEDGSAQTGMIQVVR